MARKTFLRSKTEDSAQELRWPHFADQLWALQELGRFPSTAGFKGARDESLYLDPSEGGCTVCCRKEEGEGVQVKDPRALCSVGFLIRWSRRLGSLM